MGSSSDKHFWYCSRNAHGKEDVLIARWRGAIHHVVDVHQWISGDGAIEPQCEHEDLSEENTKWLEPGSDPHVALTRVFLDTRFMHNLHHYVNFRHTGELETFHEHILMYCAKRFAYAYPAYKARNYLAALDYQFHKDRPILVNKNGEFRLHRCFSKRTGTYSCYKEKVPKTYAYVPDLLQDILNSVCSRTEAIRASVTLTPTDPRKLKKRLSGISPPSTKALLQIKK